MVVSGWLSGEIGHIGPMPADRATAAIPDTRRSVWLHSEDYASVIGARLVAIKADSIHL